MLLRISSDIEKDMLELKRFRDSDENAYIEYAEEDNIGIDFDIDLIIRYINKINETFPDRNMKYKINYQMSEKYIVDTDKCRELEKIDNYLRENYDIELLVSGNKESFGYGFRKTLSANRKLDSIAEKIKKITNNGEPLSNFEKFMVVYEYVTQYVYNEGGDVLHNETSHWVPVIEGDKIVCGGYASLLEALCSRVFDAEEVKVMKQSCEIYENETNKYKAGHANNIVYIKDEKYGVDGIFYCDPCWDSKDERMVDKPQAFCCIPIKDMLNYRDKNILFRKGITHLCLRQNHDYSDRLSEIKRDRFYNLNNEDEIESFLLGFMETEQADFCKKKFQGIHNYKISEFKEKIQEDDYAIVKEIEERIENKIKKLFKKYSKVEMLWKLSNEFIKNYNLQEHINKVCDETIDIKEIEDSMKVIAKALKDEKIKKHIAKVKEEGLYVISLYEFAKLNMKYEAVYAYRQKLEEDNKKLYKKFKSENARVIMENINQLTESSIPLEAFINSYKIIGKMKGLKNEELKKYVENRIQKGIERTAKSFDIENCKSCFATTSLGNFKKKSKQI